MVDASQGIQAQTMAHLFSALDQNLAIVPVINKIDLPAAMADDVSEELENLLAYPAEDIARISAKSKLNIEEVLIRTVKEVPSPKGNLDAPLRALVFDCRYDSYHGVIAYVRIVDGEVKAGDKLLAMSATTVMDPIEIGVLTPAMLAVKGLHAGEVAASPPVSRLLAIWKWATR